MSWPKVLVAGRIELGFTRHKNMTTPHRDTTNLNAILQVSQFLAIKDARQLANFLGTSYRWLTFRIYRSDESTRYKTFSIPKKSGKPREILAPEAALKNIQKRLNAVLQLIHSPRKTVHGFVKERNVLSNAKEHVHRRWVANVDLKDFFPSINFGRVRGMFMAVPFSFNENVATVLAQICCYRNSLPQGAPTSPVISNIICGRLDRELRELAISCRCVTSRYADDITFSTNLQEFPSEIVAINRNGAVTVGKNLEDIIIQNGFQINEEKVRLASKFQRQQVTGVVVNEKPNVSRNYVRQIRAMLHAWDKFGIEKAEKEYYQKYARKSKNPENPPPTFKEVVSGKISYLGMIKGRGDKLYAKLYRQLKRVHPEHRLKLPYSKFSNKPVVYTEGVTDVKHLRAAQKALSAFEDLEIEYNPVRAETQRINGDAELLGFCRHMSRIDNPRTVIFMFDRDVPGIIKDVHPSGLKFKAWGGNVYSFAIPIPPHRSEENLICIELYYQDSELQRKDANDRRLFLNTEFNKNTGRQITGPLSCTDLSKVKKPGIAIIDDNVFGDSHVNVALSKNAFADNIHQNVEGFNNFSFNAFSEIFRTIQEIVAHSNQASERQDPPP